MVRYLLEFVLRPTVLFWGVLFWSDTKPVNDTPRKWHWSFLPSTLVRSFALISCLYSPFLPILLFLSHPAPSYLFFISPAPQKSSAVCPLPHFKRFLFSLMVPPPPSSMALAVSCPSTPFCIIILTHLPPHRPLFQEVDSGNVHQRKPPPYPKKIYDYLDSHIIGDFYLI